MFLALVAIVTLVALPTPSSSQGDNTTLPLIRFPSKVISSNQQALCPSNEQLQMLQGEIVQDIQNLIQSTTIPALCRAVQSQASPAASCSALPTSCSSGYYWVRSRNGTVVEVFCDMDRVCGCNSTGGWTRVANLNMSDPAQQCPGGWMLQAYSSEPRRLCIRGSSGAGCSSVTYDTYGISYSHVCGRVIGYQDGATDAFGPVIRNIDSIYVDGVSITHGPPGARQHIWTFASGLAEVRHSTYYTLSCPCVSGTAAPSYVGNDYFCESGNPGPDFSIELYSSDPLWDGQGCATPFCCEFSFPPGAPWFCKQLPQATSDDIEVRICRDEAQYEDTPLELVELYIR